MRAAAISRMLAGFALCVVAGLAVPSASRGATSSTSEQHTRERPLASGGSSDGRAYALSLFSRVPLPSLARRLTTPSRPLHPVTGPPLGEAHPIDLTRYYVLPASFGVTAWARSRFPPSSWQGTASTYDGGYRFSDSFPAMTLCPDRHAALCGVTYSAESLGGDRQELRVDVVVIWLPVHVVRLPASGVVTLTGYDRTSLVGPPSGAVSVVLNPSQVSELSRAISVLRTSPGGLCMEDVRLYEISVAASQGGKVVWSATADERPGVLTVSSPHGPVHLNARSCRLDRLVASFFPDGKAKGTTQGLASCAPSF